MSKGIGRATRLLAGGVLGLSGLAFAPSAGAVVDTTEFCAAAADYDTGFTDIDAAGVHEDNVVCLAFSGITSGTTATTYSPQNNVTRGQMATFIANMIDTANELDAAGAPDLADLPDAADAEDAFTDDEGNTHEDNINRLAEAGVVAGTSATTFEPNANVSRAQMASFIAQAIEFLTGEALDEGDDAFTDDETSVHEANINRLATAEIVGGTGGGLYNPSGLVSRAQMGSFLIQGLAALHADGIINELEGDTESNQAFDVSVSETQNLGNSENDPTVIEVFFSELVPGDEYDIYLFPCLYSGEGSQVFSNGEPLVGPLGESNLAGEIEFNDDYGGTGGQPDDQADNFGSTYESELEISLIGSTPVGGQSAEDWVAPASGTLRVTLEGDGDIDCGIPVIIEDNDDDDDFALNDENEDTLENDDTPARDFAVGPAVVVYDGLVVNGDEPSDYVDFVGAAALFGDALGTGDDVGVVVHNHGSSLFGVDFDADNFYYDGAEFEGPITRDQARAYLTIGDYLETCDGESACNNIDTPYSETGANNWVFTVDELPASATGVAATVGDLDGDDEDIVDDVTVSWAAPVFGTGMGGDVDEYCVEIYDADDADNGVYDSACTDEINSQITGDAPTTITCTASDCEFEDFAPGTYRARVEYVDSETDDESGYSDWSEPFTIAGPEGPISTSATANDANGSGTVNAGDSLTIVFDEELDGTAADDSITLTDADGTECTWTDPGASTFTYADTQPGITGNETLQIALGAPDSCSAAGTTGGMQYPATIISAGNVRNIPGGNWDVANSTDVTLA